MCQQRTHTRQIMVGPVAIGGGAQASVQTMAKVDPHDAEALTHQIAEVADLGCDLIRLTIPDQRAVEVFRRVRATARLPLIADIHFDYRLALEVIEAGADGLRINPGNIGGPERVKAVVSAARTRKIPIRIGVNAGSLEPDIYAKHGSATAEALVESALRHIALLEAENYYEIKVSVKASDVLRTVAAYRLLAQQTSYPLHLGVTEAGTFIPGTVRSCVALGALLLDGIGDTIRVSLTDTPAQEVRVGLELLRSVGLRLPGAAVTSCPTCGRTCVDVVGLAQKIEMRLEKFYREHPQAARPHVAVMGCVVNGPGEAKGADIAVAGGKNTYTLFVRGVRVKSLSENDALETVVTLVKQWTQALV